MLISGTFALESEPTCNGVDSRSQLDMQDYAVSGLTKDGRFRVIAARTTLLCEEARRRHNTSRTATAVLGRCLTGAALMAVSLDQGQTVTLRVLGNGPAGGVISDARRWPDGIGVRGYMGDPGVDLPLNAEGKIDVGGAVGTEGVIYVTKDLGLKQMYTGSAKLQSGEIALDLAYYYTVSEQLPTAISIGVRVGGISKARPGSRPSSPGWVSGAGGLMVQAMPGCQGEDLGEFISHIEHNLGEMGSVSLRIQNGEEPEDLVDAVLGSVTKVNLMSRVPLFFRCWCSRDRAFATLAGLGKAELEKLAREQEMTEVRCHFCNEVYRFSGQEISDLANTLQ